MQFIRDEVFRGIFDTFFVYCSIYGETFTIIVLMALIYWCYDKKLGEYLFVSLAGANLVISTAKIAACIYRPWILDSRVKPVKEALAQATGYSFPSGHVTNATTLFAGSVLRGNFSRLLNVFLIVCMILIAFSRSYLGVHSIIDVIFGIIFSLIVLALFTRLFDRLDEKPNLDIIISSIIIILSVLSLIYALTKSYPLDYDAAGKLIVDPAILTLDYFANIGLIIGTCIAWPIERRLIRFSSEGTGETKILRGIIGFIALEIILTIILPLLGTSACGKFIGNLLIGLFIMVIYPAIIKFFQNRREAE